MRWLIILSGIVFALGVEYWVFENRHFHAPHARPRPIAARTGLTSEEQATVSLFQASSPSVVYITAEAVRRDAFRLGDVITAINDTPIRNDTDLFAALDQYQVGDTVTLTIQREGQPQRLSVTLQALS
jgi:hypothetical protein